MSKKRAVGSICMPDVRYEPATGQGACKGKGITQGGIVKPLEFFGQKSIDNLYVLELKVWSGMQACQLASTLSPDP
jgi:hypothetical protein